MILSLKSHLASHSCYMQLRRMDCITLPHESSLKRLYSNFGLDTEFLTYLRAETTKFNELERHLCMNMDEIHVKSNITYKGWFDILVTHWYVVIYNYSYFSIAGKFIGNVEFSNDSLEVEPTKTILCFMVSSLSKKWSSVVRLLPLSNPKASDLLPITLQVIKDIEQLDLFVDVIVSDNYPLNVNLFKLLGNSKELLSYVPHPTNNQRPLYLLFDFVHILKTIRNNWLNQKDYNCTFTFPCFQDICNSIYPVRESKAALQVTKI